MEQDRSKASVKEADGEQELEVWPRAAGFSDKTAALTRLVSICSFW